MSKAHLQQLDEGVALLRRAIDVADEVEDLDGISYAYANLADMLGLAGRNREALGVAHEGLKRLPRRFARRQDWMQLTVSEQAFECWRLGPREGGAGADAGANHGPDADLPGAVRGRVGARGR